MPEDDASAYRWWMAPWEFAVHTVVGMLVFAIIAAAAVLLDVVVQRLEKYGISNVIVFGLKGAEYTVFGTDLALFGIFLWRTAKRTVLNL